MSQEVTVSGEQSIYQDDMTEEAIGALFNPPDESGEAQEGEPQTEGEQEQPEQPKPDEQPEEKLEPAKEEAAPDDEFVLPLSAGETKLTSDELCNYVELGMQAKQHGEAIQGAFAFQQQYAPLVEALQNNPAQVVEYLQQQGIVQPPAPKPAPTTEDEILEQFSDTQAVKTKSIVIPEIERHVEEKYAPFVKEVQQFMVDTMYEKALSDPMAEQVDAIIHADIDEYVRAGKMDEYTAGFIKTNMKEKNPSAYVFAFNMAKKKLGNKVVQTASAPTEPTKVRRVTRAPKLEAQGPAHADEGRAKLTKILKGVESGDPESIGSLFG